MWMWLLLLVVGVAMIGNGIYGLVTGRVLDPTEFDMFTRGGEPFMYWLTVVFTLVGGGFAAREGWTKLRDGAPAEYDDD